MAEEMVKKSLYRRLTKLPSPKSTPGSGIHIDKELDNYISQTIRSANMTMTAD